MIDRVVISTEFGHDIDPLSKLMVSHAVRHWLTSLGIDETDRYQLSFNPSGQCVLDFEYEEDAVLALLSGLPEPIREGLTIEYE